MGMLVVRHKVKDYAKWRSYFDGHNGETAGGGSQPSARLRSADDKNQLLIMFKSKEFAASADLKETMVKAGVADQPTMYFLESV